jgi:His-Xaa-Ser system radical SAM maturase HxsB
MIKIEFQGGEPLLNWEVVKHIIEYAEKLNRIASKYLEFVLCTNLTLVTEDILAYLRLHKVRISTSLDGPKPLHDLHRIKRDGNSSYDDFLRNLPLVRSVVGQDACSPLLTITRDHLPRLRSVIDEYLDKGFSGIFLRAINPYGIAKTEWTTLGYPIEDFVSAYKDAFAYILEINKSGHRFIEFYASLLLNRILTPFSTGFVDLQSPSGAGISGVIYDYNGDVFPTDESRMLARSGDLSFYLGNVHSSNYEDIFGGMRLREITRQTCLEVLPGCATCFYQLYCGSDPIRNYAESGDIIGHRPSSDFCKKNMQLFDFLFDILRANDKKTLDVFWSWITNRDIKDVSL